MNTAQKKGKIVYFIGLCVVMYMAAFANTVIGVLLTNFIEYYELSSYRQGLMATFQGIGSFGAICAVILISKKLHKRTILLIGCTCLAVSILLLSTTPPLPLVLAAYLILGVGVGTNSVTTSSLCADLFDGNGAFMGVAHSVFGLGGLTGPLIMNGLLGIGIDWQIVLLIAAGISFAGFAYFAGATVYSGKRLPKKSSAGDGGVSWKAVKSVLKDSHVLLLLVAVFMYSVVQNSTNTWIKRYMTIMLDAETIGGLTLSMFWLGTMISRLILPRLKTSRLKLLCLGCFVMALCTAAVNLTESPLAALILILISTLFSGASVPMMFSEACSRHMDNTLTASSMVSLFLYCGNMSMAPVTAACMDASLTGGMYFLAGVGFIAAVILFIDIQMDKKSKAPIL